MTLTYGFYNSVSEDRKYDAIQMSRIFNGIIEDGVFASIGDQLKVLVNSGMNVAVGTGRAWFRNTWNYNDAGVLLTVDAAHATLPRIDTVVLQINPEIAARENSLLIVKGTPNSNPVPPTLIQTETIVQYPLADIRVNATVTSLVQGNITNRVGTDDCPFVTGPLSVVSTSDLLVQWESQFYDWFNYLIGELDTEVAGNLQNQITAMRGDNNPPLITLLTLKNHAHATGDGAQISSGGIAAGAIVAGKIAAGGLSATNQMANDIVDDTKVGNRVAQFYRRKGGSSTDWTSYGNNTYTPGAIRVQWGVYRWIGTATTEVVTPAISFPTAFASGNYPNVFFTGIGGAAAIIDLEQATNTSFQAILRSWETFSECIFQWLAIGAE